VTVLALEALSVRYGAVDAVRDLTLDVKPGEIVGLIGPNGAGKSSTLHAIMGAAPVAGGDVKLAGRSLVGRRSEDIARAGVALVPEGRRIFAELTVEENLRLGLAARRSAANGHALASAFDLFPILHDYRHRHAGALSGGQQQQLAIARALVSKPKVLLLDEPTEGIQPSIIKDIARALNRLKAQLHFSMLVSEQVLSFALEVADRFLILERGEFAYESRKADIDTARVHAYLTV
jgi:urea ABC transporter ATP-binding protein UrtE